MEAGSVPRVCCLWPIYSSYKRSPNTESNYFFVITTDPLWERTERMALASP